MVLFYSLRKSFDASAIDVSSILFAGNRTGEGGWFFVCSSPFCFFNWSSLYVFAFPTKYYHIMFIIIVFLLGSYGPSGLLSFMPALLHSYHLYFFHGSFSSYMPALLLACQLYFFHASFTSFHTNASVLTFYLCLFE